MDIDWSKAPVDAEFGACGRARGWSDAWYKKVGDQWFCQLMNRNDKWDTNNGPCGREDLESRPAQPWNGEGLPPVGLDCIVQHPAQQSRKVKILAHWVDGLKVPVAVYMPLEGKAYCDQAIAECFKLIRTPEQIAADAKKAHVDIMFKIVTGTPNTIYDGVEALYDAGCRIEVAP
ncbi:hypothetical protein [Pseudomonas fluorescens]|uniref:hypothetical protein n=1 Tax=Pseudomonas fluorescens TaxID=294 RepID=UPI002858FE25|nr:hypothetical protein [Pseudomonas fluorescens]MDR6163518.1 hypothetical protein [Pseudomonas fluorescens]